MKFKIIVLVFISLILLPYSKALSWNYPKDGRFKQLHPHSDSWFYTDQRWDIKAPDKWQHFTGAYISQKILSKSCNKYLSGAILLSLGILKEWEDGYREGWSARDIFVDILGIASGLIESKKCRILCLYDQEEITLNLYLSLNF